MHFLYVIITSIASAVDASNIFISTGSFFCNARASNGTSVCIIFFLSPDGAPTESQHFHQINDHWLSNWKGGEITTIIWSDLESIVHFVRIWLEIFRNQFYWANNQCKRTLFFSLSNNCYKFSFLSKSR